MYLFSFDKEKEYREIFGESSDSESNFEDFLAQNKANKRRPSGNLSDASYEQSPPPKKKRTGVKLKTKIAKTRKKQPKDREPTPVEDVSEQSSLDKENLDRIERVIKQAHTRKAKYKKRTAVAEEDIVDELLTTGPSKEDVQMFKLALARLAGEEDGLAEGVHWAHYPDDILFVCVWGVCVCVGECVCVVCIKKTV